MVPSPVIFFFVIFTVRCLIDNVLKLKNKNDQATKLFEQIQRERERSKLTIITRERNLTWCGRLMLF